MESSHAEKMDPEPQIPPAVKTEILTRTRKRKVLMGEADQVELLPVHRAQLDNMKEAEAEEQERQDELFERWLHSPERTKKWRRKLARMEQAEAAKDEGPLADMWVQCENPDCLKWRRLTAQQGTKVDGSAPWFCSMNPNAAYRACSEPQEDFIQVERMARRLGIKYISTSLLEGTVVWAKMPGFCRWPAVVTTDYNFGVHVYVDADDEPLSYHVEYLGEVHTRGWMRAAQVALYGSVDEEKQLEEAAAPDPSRKKRRSHDKKPNEKGCRTSFFKQGMKCTIQTARQEADELMNLSIAERLTRVVFGHSSFQPTITTTDNDVVEKGQSSVSKQPKPSIDLMKKPAPKTKPKVKPSSSKASAKTAEAPKVAPPSPQPSVTGREAIRRQIKGETGMINCSNKEEKFTIDVQMYKKNEKAFEHDVRRFMIRNERPIRQDLPVWKGVPVNLFQLFLAVYDRGGYLQAIEKRQFQQIFREMTGTSLTTGSTVARHYYERNLYPYELYINNKDYSHCFETDLNEPSAARGKCEDSSATKGKKRRKPRQTLADTGIVLGADAMTGFVANQEVPSASTSSKHSENSFGDGCKDNITFKQHSQLPHSLAKPQHDNKTPKFLLPHSAMAAAGVDTMSRHAQPPCTPTKWKESEALCTPPTGRQGGERHPNLYNGGNAMSPIHSSQEVPTVSGSEDDYHHEGMADHELREIDNMLSQLDSFSTGFYSTNDCSYFGGEKVEHPLSDGSVQAWTHHFREADSASASGQPTMPLEGAQVVPEVEEELEYIEL